MLSLSYDLHIHSCLSPCGDDDSKPSDIAGMAYIKQLDAFALTDHNTSRNCPAAKAVADELGILFIPGMELTTQEEIHVVCLFDTIEKALEWDKFVYSHLIKVKNRTEIFGNQFVLDEKDNIIDSEPYLLINATDISFVDSFKLVHEFGGIAFPAHIDRPSDSVLSQLGYIPDECTFKRVELKDITKFEELSKKHTYLKNCKAITSSDAHYLENINEPTNFIHVDCKNINSILKEIENK